MNRTRSPNSSDFFCAEATGQQFGKQMIAAIPANVFGPGEDFSPEQLVH